MVTKYGLKSYRRDPYTRFVCKHIKSTLSPRAKRADRKLKKTQSFMRYFWIFGRMNIKSGTAQRLVEHHANCVIIVGNENSGRHQVPPSSMSDAVYTGRKTRKSVPFGVVSHSITPPWSSINLATSARPRPVPPDFVVINGSKRCRAISSEIPGPLSETVIINGK